MNDSADDHYYMQRALRLAAAATRRAAPSPAWAACWCATAR